MAKTTSKGTKKSTDKELFCLTEKEYIWWRNLIDYNTIQILLEGKLLNANIGVESENSNLIAEKIKAMCIHSRIEIGRASCRERV